MTPFHQNIISIYGVDGQRWLDQLPVFVVEMAEAWGLRDLEPLENLSYNYVLSGFQNDIPIILKMGLDREGLTREALALRVFEGHGAVGVLDQREGALLLERAVPGTSLKSYFPDSDENAIAVNCDLIQTLHLAQLPATGSFPHIRDWLSALDTFHDDLSDPHFTQALDKARRLRHHLLETSPGDVFLHGDLHHENILRHGEGFVVIDPKGVMGDPAFEVGAFIRNPIPKLLEAHNAVDILTTRIEAFASRLEMDPQRILQWCYVEAVLSWVWNREDGLCPNYFRDLTMIFGRLMGEHTNNLKKEKIK